MMRILFLVILLAVIMAGLSFAVENAHQVEFNYFVGSRQVPLSMLIVLSVFAGTLLGVLASLGVVLRLKNQIRLLKRSEATARQEIRNLRTMPLKDSP